MKKFIRDINEHAKLYRDDKSGIAWIEDGSTGIGFSVHPNIHKSGRVAGMKNLSYWGRKDRTIRSHGWIYNIDRFVCDSENEMEKIVAAECQCPACIERRRKVAS